jgi:hypothetical protein
MHAENGAWLGGAKDWLIADNTIIAIHSNGGYAHAFRFRGSDHFMIRNNIIYARSGLFLDDHDGPKTNNVIKENQITANNAIYLINITKSEILRNNMCILDTSGGYSYGPGGIFFGTNSKNNRIISNKGFSGNPNFQVVAGEFDRSNTVVRHNILSLEACIPFVLGGSSEPGVCWS